MTEDKTADSNRLLTEPSRLPRESEFEQRYRQSLVALGGRLGATLAALQQKLADHTTTAPDLLDLTKQVQQVASTAKALFVPESLKEPHQYFLNACASYDKAFALVSEQLPLKSALGILRAGRFFGEGNSWLNISKARMWAIYEAKG